jgi:hypothetical protein
VSLDSETWEKIASSPDTHLSYNIRLYEIGTWRLIHEIKSVSDDSDSKKDTYLFTNIRFSRDGNRLIASGTSCRDVSTKFVKGISHSRGKFEYDLSWIDGDWRYIGSGTLPLHPDGKFLLDGRLGSAPVTGFSERLGGAVSGESLMPRQ